MSNPAITVKDRTPIIALDDMKDHLRHTHTDSEDHIISALTVSMQEVAEVITMRRWNITTMALTLKNFTEFIKLPYGSPLTEVSSIQYYDSSNQLQTLNSANYDVYTHKEPGEIKIINSPGVYERDDAIIITYKAGYANLANIPESVKIWLKMSVANKFIFRTPQLVGATVGTVEEIDEILFNERVMEI